MKGFFLKTISAFIMVITISVFAQELKVKGRLLGADGKPHKDALVGIMGETTVAKDFVKCDEKGNYEIRIIKPDVNRILFSIPDHNAEKVIVINSSNKQIKLDVTLDYYKYKETFDEVAVTGDFNDYNISSPLAMTKKEDGTYFYEVKTDKPIVKYQLCKIEFDNRTINSPNTKIFEADSTGDYRSIIEAKNGKAVIVFDPAKLKKGEGKAKVIMEGDPLSSTMNKDNTTQNELLSEASMKMKEYYDKNNRIDGFEFDDGGKVAELLKKAETETNKELSEYYKLNYVTFFSVKIKGYDPFKASEFYESVSPKSIAWELVPLAFSSYYQILPQFKWKANEEKFLREAASNKVKLNIYVNKLASARFSSNEEEIKRLHEVIKKELGNYEPANLMLKNYPIEIKIKVGAEIPDYEVVSLDNKEEKFSKKSMLGKIYLIDFWATWCGPCVGEMEHLHQTFEKFKDKGFEILSLSSDMSIKEIEKFRGDKWKMPWKHSFINNPEGKKISEAFEVIGIPKPLLIGKDGKILATEKDLRGSGLEKTVAKYFQ